MIMLFSDYAHPYYYMKLKHAELFLLEL